MKFRRCHRTPDKQRGMQWATLTITVLTGAMLFNNTSHAAVSEETVHKLIAQIESLTERVRQLEQADQALREENIALRSESKIAHNNNNNLAWAEHIKIGGDFRYRYENIDDASNAKEQNRSRLRARIEAQAQINDSWTVGVGLASGDDDPLSSNQSLGSNASSKGINLDTAYFDWSGINNTHIVGGKFKTPFYQPAGHKLAWDDDYRPEGLAVKYDNGRIFANGAFLYLESDDKAGAQDAESLWGSQLGVNIPLADKIQLILGLSYYDIPVAGSKPFFGAKALGNTLITDGVDMVYKHDYREVELFAELLFELAKMPAGVFYDRIENRDAGDNELGWAAGAKLGATKSRGDWQLAYIYQDLEADAVFGHTTDSDFGGGGTNVKGHLIKAAFAIDENVALALSWYINEVGDLETDYDRLQMDLNFKY